MFRTESIRPGQDGYDDITALLQSTFPPEELLAPEMFVRPMPYLRFLDGDDTVGCAQVIETPYAHFLLYLAILESRRSMGYGGMALESILANRGGLPLFLNIEPVVEGLSDRDPRVRRYNFYRRHGLVDSGYSLLVGGCHLTVISTGETGIRALMERLYKESFRYPGGFFTIYT